VVPLEPPLLKQVHSGERGGEREPGERREHEADVEDEKDVGIVAARPKLGSPAEPRNDEQRGDERRYREPEQPIARAAAPYQIRGDDEPDEEVQRAGPPRPGGSVRP